MFTSSTVSVADGDLTHLPFSARPARGGMTQLIPSAATPSREAAWGTSAIAAVAFSGPYSGVHWRTEVLAGRPLAAALTLLFTSSG